MKKKIYRFFISIILIGIVGVISNWLVRNTPIGSYSIFNPASLFAYFGVLIGFSLTIYTFGLSMVSDIKINIEKIKKFSPEDKEKMYTKLISGFSEIKQDIWLIFWAIILIIIFEILRGTTNPFGWNVEQYKIPETVNITLFIATTLAMYDIMKTLFNLSEINLELIKNDNKQDKK